MFGVSGVSHLVFQGYFTALFSFYGLPLLMIRGLVSSFRVSFDGFTLFLFRGRCDLYFILLEPDHPHAEASRI